MTVQFVLLKILSSRVPSFIFCLLVTDVLVLHWSKISGRKWGITCIDYPTTRLNLIQSRLVQVQFTTVRSLCHHLRPPMFGTET